MIWRYSSSMSMYILRSVSVNSIALASGLDNMEIETLYIKSMCLANCLVKYRILTWSRIIGFRQIDALETSHVYIFISDSDSDGDSNDVAVAEITAIELTTATAWSIASLTNVASCRWLRNARFILLYTRSTSWTSSGSNLVSESDPWQTERVNFRCCCILTHMIMGNRDHTIWYDMIYNSI